MHTLRLRKGRTGVGFTLVELLAVMTIIVILAGILLGAITVARRQARRSVAIIELKQIEQALEAYRFDFNFYPPDYHLATAEENWEWDSGQCLFFYLGSVYRAGQPPTPIAGAAPAGWVSDRSAPAYFEFPADRIDADGRFIDRWGMDERDGPGQLYYYQFDNNEEDITKQSWGDAVALPQADGRGPYNWNMTNVHPNGVDVWSPGPAGVDHITTDTSDPQDPYHVTADSPVLETFRARYPDMVGNW